MAKDGKTSVVTFRDKLPSGYSACAGLDWQPELLNLIRHVQNRWALGPSQCGCWFGLSWHLGQSLLWG